MGPDDIAHLLRGVLQDMQAAGELPPDGVEEALPTVRGPHVERGTYVSPVALRLARSTGGQPRDLASLVADRMRRVPAIAGVEITGPGFLEVATRGAPGELARTIVDSGPYGRHRVEAARVGPTVVVASDPTASRRAAAAATALRRLFAAVGARPSLVLGPVPDGVAAPAADDPAGGTTRTVVVHGVRRGGTRGDSSSPWNTHDRQDPDPDRDLEHDAGRDALRYTLLRCPNDAVVEVDPEAVRRRRPGTPFFDVAYAHARGCVQAALAEEDGVRRSDGFEPATLTDAQDVALLAVLGDFPRVVEEAAAALAPARVARYLERLAGAAHPWYDGGRVRPRVVHGTLEDVTDGHRTRLWLSEATRMVLASGLTLLDVAAPERL